MCLTEWKVENLLKSKMSLLSVAALLQHEKNSESLALGHSHEYHSHRKENLANAVSSGFSSFFICWGPSQAALLGEMSLKMAVSQDSQAEILQTSTSFAVHTGTGIYFPSCSLFLTYWTFTPGSFIAYFQEQLVSPSRKPSQRADSGLSSQLLCTFPNQDILCTFYKSLQILEVRSLSTRLIPFPLAAVVKQSHNTISLLGTPLKSPS